MCDICAEAFEEALTFYRELAKKFPGTELDGVEVEPDHHAFVAFASVCGIASVTAAAADGELPQALENGN